MARMIFSILFLGFVLSFTSVSEARGRRNFTPLATTVHAVSNVVSRGENATAQGVANIMARLGQVGHHGGNPGYEGCGCASTKEGAYNICCYANSGMKTVDVGYAQASNGMWFCCRRYSTR